jgi:hypothetical protein
VDVGHLADGRRSASLEDDRQGFISRVRTHLFADVDTAEVDDRAVRLVTLMLERKGAV